MDEPEDLVRFFRIAREKEVGVIAMKVVARGTLIKQGLDINKLLLYVLSYPVSTVIVGITSIPHLEENVRVAKDFQPMGKEEMAEFEKVAQNMSGTS